MTQDEADKAQNWSGMDGAIAWHLIDRHADDWNEVGEMANAWLRANQPDLSPVIAWLENGCDPKEAAKELRIYQQRMRSNVMYTPNGASTELYTKEK